MSESSLVMDTEEMSASLNLIHTGPVKAVMLIGSDRLGRGDDELGQTLMHSMLRSVFDAEPRPWRVLLVNHGGHLATTDEVAVDLLGLLEQVGVDVLSCGTCLTTLGLVERLGAGRVTTMPEIVESLNRATKITSI
jgi:selenium metabolism protein YedF